jgi:methionine-rich copper-binding protein CopC
MKPGKPGLLGIILVVVVAGGWTPAFAHSFPERETPAAGQTLTAPPSEVTIKYDAPIEKVFAKLDVLDSSGKNQAVGQPIYGPDGDTLSTKVAPLKPGTYTVKWAIVSVDTHRTQGSYTFTVAKSA